MAFPMARYNLSGAIAGTISAFSFTIIHDIFISDIWFSLLPMLIAGALCGLCISWSHILLLPWPKFRNWLIFNGIWVVMFILLGLVSVVIYEPVTTMAALIAANGPPTELINQAGPMTAIFTLAVAIALALYYRASWRKFLALLLTSVVLVALLGLNVSTIGLVSIPGSGWFLVLEMFILIIVLNLVYVAVFTLLERRSWRAMALSLKGNE